MFLEKLVLFFYKNNQDYLISEFINNYFEEIKELFKTKKSS